MTIFVLSEILKPSQASPSCVPGASSTIIYSASKQTHLTSRDSFSFINSNSAVTDLTDLLVDIPTNPPSLYLDFEGIDLSRQGTISNLQVLVATHSRACLIDINTLGSEVFSSAGANGQTLMTNLEVRNGSDTLYIHKRGPA